MSPNQGCQDRANVISKPWDAPQKSSCRTFAAISAPKLNVERTLVRMLYIELSGTEVTSMVAYRRWFATAIVQALTRTIHTPEPHSDIDQNMCHSLNCSTSSGIKSVRICSNVQRKEHQSPALKWLCKPGSGLYCTLHVVHGRVIKLRSMETSPIRNAAHPCSTNGLQRGRYQVCLSRILGECVSTVGRGLTTIYMYSAKFSQEPSFVPEDVF